MTDPTGVPPLPPAPPAALRAPTTEAEPWQLRFEVLALLLLASVAVVLIAGLVTAYAQLGTVTNDFTGVEQPAAGLDEIVRVGGASANLMVSGALLVALLLVTLGPGDRIGRRGTTVLRGLVGVGLVSSGLAAVSSVLTVMYDADQQTSARLAGEFVSDGVIGRVSGVTPLLVAATLAGYVAWCAFSTLGEVPAGPVVPGDDAGTGSDLATAAEGAWAPPPAPLP